MYSKDELKNLKLEFWESFAAYCEVQPYLRGRKKMWTLYDTKVKGVELKFDISRNGAYVILEVNHRSEELRLEMYERLTWYKEMLEQHPDLYLIASGGVSSMEDIRALETAGVPAVIFGKALYEGRITLKEIERMMQDY